MKTFLDRKQLFWDVLGGGVFLPKKPRKSRKPKPPKDPVITEDRGWFRYKHRDSWPYILIDVVELVGGGAMATFKPDFLNDDMREAVLVQFPDGTKYFTKEHTASEVLKRIYRLE